MARYFFDLHDCGTLVSDPDGVEAVDLAAAKLRALDAARDVMAGEVRRGRLCLGCHIDVRGPDGVSARVLFRDAVQITGL